MWEAGRNPSDVFKGLVMRIVTLLRSGGDFIEHYLYNLVNGIVKYNPDVEIYCLTDMHIEHKHIKPIFMQDLPPKWWGKLLLFELFKEGSTLYMDIDTVCVGKLNTLFRTTKGFTMLENVYRKGHVGSGVMSWMGDYSSLTEEYKSIGADVVHREYTTTMKWGDQGFIEHNLREKPDFFGSKCLSYKAQVANKMLRLPKETALVYFHGKPRPWEISSCKLALWSN